MKTTFNNQYMSFAQSIAVILLSLILYGLGSCSPDEGNLNTDHIESQKELLTDTISDTTLVEHDTITDEQTYVVVDQMPEYPGGLDSLYRFLTENINYPIEAQEKGIQGRVFINFIIDTDGSVTDVYILKGVDPSLDNEALRVVKMMPDWTPGIQDGEKVRVSFTLPINFILKDSKRIKIEEIHSTLLTNSRVNAFNL